MLRCMTVNHMVRLGRQIFRKSHSVFYGYIQCPVSTVEWIYSFAYISDARL